MVPPFPEIEDARIEAMLEAMRAQRAARNARRWAYVAILMALVSVALSLT